MHHVCKDKISAICRVCARTNKQLVVMDNDSQIFFSIIAESFEEKNFICILCQSIMNEVKLVEAKKKIEIRQKIVLFIKNF